MIDAEPFRSADIALLRTRLLSWYDAARRELPWRAPPGTPADPYAVWLSEIMLQQTTVAAVIPYFRRFLARWPDVASLARADLDEILVEWQGLGYYARARNLHACAKKVAGEGGGFPEDEGGLRALPGVGAYTAAAIAAIAFGRRAAAVDGNIERAIARLFAIETPLPVAKAKIRALAGRILCADRPGDFTQAMMDLGATLCAPRKPDCTRCPLSDLCLSKALGKAESLPRRAPKAARPKRFGVAFWLTRETQDGALVLLRRRPETGLLGGMMEVPSTPWGGALDLSSAAISAHQPAPAAWRVLDGAVRHVFTHFSLELSVAAARTEDGASVEGQWWPIARLGEQALPTLMKKVARKAVEAKL